MKQHDDYISGPHHYWFQFVGGFVFGTALGAYLVFDEFENGVTILLVSLGTGLALAFACGRWGETAWRYISEWFQTWWRVL